jgi:chemotaxis protein CheX
MTEVSEPITLPEIGDAIHAAAEEVFSVMLGIDLAPGEPQIGQAGQDHSGVVAVLGLTGDWVGSGQISCDSALARRMASSLLMSEYDMIDEEVLDAVGEVANMIIGNVKTSMERTLGPMGLSAPAVFFGGDFETRVVGKPNMVLVPFACAEGMMTVQIAVAPSLLTRLRHRTGMPGVP